MVALKTSARDTVVVSSSRALLAACAALLASAPVAAAPKAVFADGGGLVQRHLDLARSCAAAGDLEGARAHFERVLERDASHLASLAALARLARDGGRADEAVDHAGRFLDAWRHRGDPPRELFDTRRELAAFVREADPLREDLVRLRRSYVGSLLSLAARQMDRAAWHSARTMLAEALVTDPEHPDLAAGLARIRLEGGNELAVEDETGGADPMGDVSPEWIAEHDPEHASWPTAWTLETEHYRIRTDAGYRVLRIVGHAMEQMQRFYRVFHQYKVDGGAVPVAGVHIFKDRSEYRTLGGSPVDWAAGHWNGTNVVTYDQREGGQGSLRDTLGVLFHEASHQFTSLAGGSAVPAWLNEGMASFFEGTRLLSNGRIDWNLVAPGRLYPLLDDLRSARPHDLQRVITGAVDDYRVYYPWGWGICYFLYNAEDESGRLLYRALMREYFQEYDSSDHLARFEAFFIERAAVEGVSSLDEFEQRFVAFVERLEAEDRGLVDAARAMEERGDLQAAREDWERASKLYDRSLERDPDHPGVLWKLAHALEEADLLDRAAGALRQWLAVVLLEGGAEGDPEGRVVVAEARLRRLDKTARRLQAVRSRFHTESVALARSYRELGFPRTALRVLRGPATAVPPSFEARELFFAIEDETGLSLARWKLLFNERDLSGFYGGGEGSFRVSDGVILARVEGEQSGAGGAPATGPVEDGGDVFLFRRLFIDHEPTGDWSLEAEVAMGSDCRMAGVCFGKKADGLFHGVALLPGGHLDLSSFGADGRPLVRVGVAEGEGWRTLRVDVTGTNLTVGIDGAQAIEYAFPSRAALRGDFGLLAGSGSSSFREVKILDHDRGLPRRLRVGRRAGAAAGGGGGLAAGERAPAALTRYLGKAPPLLRGLEWHGDAPQGGDLDRLLGWPLVLVFWTSLVETSGTTRLLDGLGKVEELCRAHAIPLLFIDNEPPEALAAWLAERPNPWPVGSGYGQEAYEDYAIADPTVQLPRVLVIGSDGRVVWEGNPDYHPDFGTYADQPLAELVEREELAALLAAREAEAAAQAAWVAGRYAEAGRLWGPIAAIENALAAVVVRAREGLERLAVLAADRRDAARAFEADGRRLQAMAALRGAASEFAGTPGGEEAAREAEELAETKAYRAALRVAHRLERAERGLGGDPGALRAALEKVLARSEPTDDPWVAERLTWLLKALEGGLEGGALGAAYGEAFPALGEAGD